MNTDRIVYGPYLSKIYLQLRPQAPYTPPRFVLDYGGLVPVESLHIHQVSLTDTTAVPVT